MSNTIIMEQKNKILPELRFPEFLNEGEWEEKKLGEVANIKRGAASNNLNYVEKNSISSIRLIRINDFLSNQPVYVESTEEMTRYRIRSGDILIAGTGATAGITFMVPDEFDNLAYSYNVPRIRLHSSNNFFVYYYLNSTTILEQQKRMFVGNAQPFLDTKAIGSFNLYLPKNDIEQQKIADCLTSLDEVITAHNDKLEALKNHKKGLLQNLFPQEGQTVPNYRFPEFMNDGDWEIKTVSEVAYYENGKAHEQHIIINGKYKVVNSKFISTDGEVVKYTNEALCLADINDTLMVLSDVPNGRAIAKCFYVDKNNTYTVNQRICKLKPLDINGKILYYLLNRNPYFLAFDDGVKQTNLKNDDVLNCEIVLPKKTKIQKEQQKIADCLMEIDNLITAQTEKIEQLKAHKKGLMQGLFPKID